MDSLLGMEFSGRDDFGRRVMGIVPAQVIPYEIILYLEIAV